MRVIPREKGGPASRPEMESEIELESAKEGEAVGWQCDIKFDGMFNEITTTNDRGFRSVVRMPASSAERSREEVHDIGRAFMKDTIAEVRKRRSVRAANKGRRNKLLTGIAIVASAGAAAYEILSLLP